MAYFTCITSVRESIHISQVIAEDAPSALREAIASLPYDAGSNGPFNEELKWLIKVSEGQLKVTMAPVTDCINTWLWEEGAEYEPQYLSFVVKTDAS